MKCVLFYFDINVYNVFFIRVKLHTYKLKKTVDLQRAGVFPMAVDSVTEMAEEIVVDVIEILVAVAVIVAIEIAMIKTIANVQLSVSATVPKMVDVLLHILLPVSVVVEVHSHTAIDPVHALDPALAHPGGARPNLNRRIFSNALCIYIFHSLIWL